MIKPRHYVLEPPPDRGLHLRTIQGPRGQAAHVVLSTVRTGICRSDVREWLGQRAIRSDFGHEIVGVLQESHGFDQLPIGSRVIYDPHAGVEKTSGYANIIEMRGSAEGVANALVPLPHAVDDDCAPFIEPLACAIHCVRRLLQASSQLSLDAESDSLIVGAGMSGTLMYMIMQSMDMNVRLTNRTSSRLDFLESRGVLHPGHRADWRDGHPPNRVIVATSQIDEATKLLVESRVRPNALVVIFSGTRPGTIYNGLDIDALRRNESLTAVRGQNGVVHWAGSYGATPTDFDMALRLVQQADRARQGISISEKLRRLVTHSLTLSEASQAFEGGTLPRLGKTLIHYP